VKFTEKGGTVRIRCLETREPPSGGTLHGTGPWVGLCIEDTGIGITPDQLPTIFRAFVQASMGHTRSHGGTGLGLSISQQLARLMNGDISVASEPGEGSAFTLWLPTPDAAASEPGATDGAGQLRAGMARHVGLALIRDAQLLVGTYVRRIRKDPEIPQAAGMLSPSIADHLASLIADCGQALTIVGEVGHDADLLRDSSDIQRLIAERHGEQRARHRWPEDAVMREFVILRSVLEDFVHEQSSGGGEPSSVLQMLEGFINNAQHVSLQSFRNAGAGAPRDL
jgi:hypothetical protein